MPQLHRRTNQRPTLVAEAVLALAVDHLEVAALEDLVVEAPVVVDLVVEAPAVVDLAVADLVVEAPVVVAEEVAAEEEVEVPTEFKAMTS